MSRLLLEIKGLPHCPRNRSHAIFRKGKGSFLGKTEAAHSYEKALLFHLEKFKSQALTFKDKFNTNEQHLIANWSISSPDCETKSGKLSETGVDLDAHKVLQDTIMGFVGINDAYIKKDCREKYQGDYCITLELIIRDNNGAYLL